MIDKSEFLDWKNSVVTQAFFAHLEDRREALKETLANNAGDNPYQDSLQSGYFKALTDILGVEFEDVENGQ